MHFSDAMVARFFPVHLIEDDGINRIGEVDLQIALTQLHLPKPPILRAACSLVSSLKVSAIEFGSMAR
ncbi:hypothetical protein D3C85_1819370 [compost metagenome]